MPQDIFDAVDHYLKQKYPDIIAEGEIQSTNDVSATVKITGTSNVQEAYFSRNVAGSVGERCVMIRPRGNQRWIIMAVFGTKRTGNVVRFDPNSKYELAPPSNFVATDILPGIVLFTWDAPPQQPVAFEIQTSLDGTEEPDEDADEFLTTRGSYALVESAVEIFGRIRSVAPDFKRSSWSEWESSTPGVDSSAPNNATYITQTPNAGLSAEQALSSLATGQMRVTTATGVITSLKDNIGATVAPTVNEDSGDGYSIGSRWYDTTADKEYVALDVTVGAAVWIETTGAGSSPDASDVTYTPAVGADWGTDPDDVAEGLDQLAERLTDIEAGEPDAPTDATYITQTPNSELSSEQALSALATGIMKVTTTTGVVSSITDSAGVAAVISDETGSGALVFGTAPTLGAPVIADFTAAQHDHGDADDGGLIDASVLTYTPAVLTDWDGDADPGDVDNALDQLAERVDDLEIAPPVHVHDAADITYAPSDNTDWNSSADPGDTNDALDQLADRLKTVEAGEPDAPPDATYITQTPSAGLSAEQALSALATGIMKVTTTTGVVSSITDSAGVAAAISDETGSGALVFGTSPTLATPTIADFTNAQHDHSDADDGGTIRTSSLVFIGY